MSFSAGQAQAYQAAAERNKANRLAEQMRDDGFTDVQVHYEFGGYRVSGKEPETDEEMWFSDEFCYDAYKKE